MNPMMKCAVAGVASAVVVAVLLVVILVLTGHIGKKVTSKNPANVPIINTPLNAPVNTSVERFASTHDQYLSRPRETAKGVAQYGDSSPYAGLYRINYVLRDNGYEVAVSTPDSQNNWTQHRTPAWLLNLADFDRRGFAVKQDKFNQLKADQMVREVIPYFSSDLQYYYLPASWATMVNPTHPLTGQSLRPADVISALNDYRQYLRA